MLCQILRIYGLTVVGIVGSQSKVRSCKARNLEPGHIDVSAPGLSQCGPCCLSQANIVIDKSHEDWVVALDLQCFNG